MQNDTGKHYRFIYTKNLSMKELQEIFNVQRTSVDLKLDPYRIMLIYGITDPAIQHSLKKLLCCGKRGHNSVKEDIEDVICALQRRLEIFEEDAITD